MSEQRHGDNQTPNVQPGLAPASIAESATSHPLLQIAVSGAAALLGTLPVLAAPLAGLLPTLANIPAAERYKARMEAALKQVNATLKEQAQRLREMSDAQYKLVNEAILALLATTCEEKLEQLKVAIGNAVAADVEPQEAAALARVLRDISAAEAVFLTRTFGHSFVEFGDGDRQIRPKTYYAKPGTSDEVIVSGLLSLGLLKTTGTESFWNSTGVFQYTALAAKLLVLLSQKSDGPFHEAA